MGVGAAPHSTDHQSPENWTLENSNCKIYKRVQRASAVRRALARRRALSLAKPCSIGFRWGCRMAGRAAWRRLFDCLADPGDLVGTEIVYDDDVATCQRGNQNLLNIGEEQLAIDRSVEHAGGDQGVLAQAGIESGGVPVPMGYCVNQPVTHLGPAVEPDHVRLGPGLIDEDQPTRVVSGSAAPLARAIGAMTRQRGRL